MATCPECDAEIEVDDTDLEDMEVGDPWDCDACGSRLRVAILDPLDFDTDDDEEDDDEEEKVKEGAEEAEEPADDDAEDDDGSTDEDGGAWQE